MHIPVEPDRVVVTFVDGSTHRAEILERFPPKVWAVD
jgi:hypothetical protein